jgi:arginase
MEKKLNLINVYGYASAIAGAHHGTALGPIYIQPLIERLAHYQWQDIVYPRGEGTKLQAQPIIADTCKRLGLLIQQTLSAKNRFLVVGGDHSSAIGTWSSAAAACNHQLGLLWIDAHMDAHTPESSQSKNIHGMPLAMLLGQGPEQLVHLFSDQPSFKPEHICLIGQRDYEPQEYQRLHDLGVKIYFQKEVNEHGIEQCLEQAMRYLLASVPNIGLSIDLDAFEPTEVPAVAVPAKNGLHIQPFLTALNKQIKQHQQAIIGYEIAEFAPQLDRHNKTLTAITQLLNVIK